MITIAFASKDGVFVNEHFGWCEKFFIYEVDEKNSKLLKEVDSPIKHDSEVDKLEYKIECIDSSDILYVSQIGPKAANMVKYAGTYPMKSSSEEEKIEDVLASMQNLLSSPPLWLQRILLK